MKSFIDRGNNPSEREKERNGNRLTGADFGTPAAELSLQLVVLPLQLLQFLFHLLFL